MIRKYRYKLFKLKLFLYRHCYDNIIEFISSLINRFLDNQLKLPIIYGNIIITFLFTFYIYDISTMLKALFMIFFYFLLNNFLFYDVGTAIMKTQLSYCLFITLSPIVSMLMNIKEELYLVDWGGIVVQSFLFSFFNVLASIASSLLISMFILFVVELLDYINKREFL